MAATDNETVCRELLERLVNASPSEAGSIRQELQKFLAEHPEYQGMIAAYLAKMLRD